ncbi:MAG: TIGR01459 family HAD-type hydrolase [Kiloniellales bacterium]|nr:TIGR01459 family HAD-type hydrolase [Kiloniellales bacterium]
MTEAPSANSPVPIHDGMAALADSYDAFILDLWGVLHNGIAAYPHAIDCLKALKARGKKLLVLSNAPRRAAGILERNIELGLVPELYDALHSSGEETWLHLKERPDAWYRDLGRRGFHLGPARDLGIREGLEIDFVDDLAEADFILNTGADRAEDRVEDFEDLLRAARARNLPMVCANPDLVVMRGAALEICAGAIAARYEALGAEVRYHGKPYADVYRRAFALLGVKDPSRIAGVGDSFRTDIAGARAAGIDGIFVAGGIHIEELAADTDGRPDPDRLAVMAAESGHHPAAVLPVFRW